MQLESLQHKESPNKRVLGVLWTLNRPNPTCPPRHLCLPAAQVYRVLPRVPAEQLGSMKKWLMKNPCSHKKKWCETVPSQSWIKNRMEIADSLVSSLSPAALTKFQLASFWGSTREGCFNSSGIKNPRIGDLGLNFTGNCPRPMVSSHVCHLLG